MVPFSFLDMCAFQIYDPEEIVEHLQVDIWTQPEPPTDLNEGSVNAAAVRDRKP